MPTDTERIQEFTIDGDKLVSTIKDLVHEGNVRRVVVKQHGKMIAEFPVTVGVIGAVLAPIAAAIGGGGLGTFVLGFGHSGTGLRSELEFTARSMSQRRWTT